MRTRKEDVELVSKVIDNQNEMNALTVDKINELAPALEEKEPEVKLSTKEIARMEGVRYIEPLKKLQAFGTLPDKWKAKRDRDWEYVKGIFENDVQKGEPIRFTYCKWPGDPDCMWEVPANTPCYVPRFVAKLLSGEKDEDTGIQAMNYHTFNHMQRAQEFLRKDDFMEQFSVSGTLSRGKFRAIGAF